MEKSNPSPASADLGEAQSRKSDIETADLVEGRRQQNKTRKNQIVKYKCTNLDDGYTWRKYGERSITTSKYPRSYFRCRDRNTMGCHAMKQTEQDDDDPNTFHVTYIGAHTCRQQELQTTSTMAQGEELHSDLQSTSSFEFMTKSGQSGNDQPPQIHVVSKRIRTQISDSYTRFHSSKKKVNQQAPKRLEYTDSILGAMMNKGTVVSLLQSDSVWKHNVSIVSIVGAEGAGKTTLARLAYDDPMVCEAFELRAWVCLTRVHNVEDLLRAMIKALTALSCHPSEELSDLQEIVKEEVMSRKYLLVLDNICDAQILGSELLTPLRFCGKGSKILLTAKEELSIDTTLWMTRSYKLNNMSEDDCWQVMMNAFCDTYSNVYPDLTEVRRRTVRRCEGNPLAARAVGGILRAKVYDPTKSGYDVLNKFIWKLHKNETNILLALRLNYRFLPYFLKKCLLYCSLFPKGYVFEGNHLIQLWMAQGYIESQVDKEEEEEIGIKYLYELRCRCFLQPSCNPNFTKQCYEMHDLVYDLLQTVSRKEVSQEKDYKKAHIVSFIFDKFGSSSDFEALKESRDMQSLLIDRHMLEYSGRKKIQILSPKILSDLLDSLVHLNALDLSFSNIKDLPNSIAKLKTLSYLGLNDTNIRNLPPTLCNLYNLQTLELRDCVYLQNLPEEINMLVNLRHLDIRKKSSFIGIPRGLGRLTRLRTLSAFSVAEEKDWHSGISELQNLVNLRGDVCIGGLRHVTDEKDAEEADLSNKQSLESLTLQWSASGREIEADEMSGKANKVLENLKPYRNLKQLVVRDYSGDQFPAWIGNPSFSKLISLTLDNCRWCKELPPLGRITSLKHLLIRRMDSVQSLGAKFLGYEGSHFDLREAFPSLETLKIWEMYNLEEWSGIRSTDIPCLRSISISRCFKLRRLPCLRSLEELTIHHGVEVPFFSNIRSLRSLTIEGFHSLNTLILQPGMTSVLKLEVKDCSQLSSLLGLKNSKTLREIRLDKCPILDLQSDELPMKLEVVDIHHSCSLLSTWCPSDFHENANFSQEIRRRLVREKQQDDPVHEPHDWLSCPKTPDASDVTPEIDGV